MLRPFVAPPSKSGAQASTDSARLAMMTLMMLR